MRDSVLDAVSRFANQSFSKITSDKGVKAELISKAITSVTGITPIIDERDPNVTWVRLLPAHGDYVDSVFLKSAKKITDGPNKGETANMKIDVMPALKPVLFRRFLPLTLSVVGGIFFMGYLYGRRK